VLGGDNEIGSFQHGLDSKREQTLKINSAERIVGADRVFFCRIPRLHPSEGRKMVRPVSVSP
jgi:hypothetical protein